MQYIKQNRKEFYLKFFAVLFNILHLLIQTQLEKFSFPEKGKNYFST